MPQVAFFVGAAASGVGGVAILMAWDRHDRGPTAADEIAIDDVALYSWVAVLTGAKLIKIKTKVPISVPAENCPNLPDGAPDEDYVVRFEVKPGGTALGSVADFSLDIFDDSSNRVYGVAPEGKALKFDLADNSILSDAISIQDRPTLQPWEDNLEGLAGIVNLTQPTKEIWRALMTPDQPLEWF
jgi:hypothetical protein